MKFLTILRCNNRWTGMARASLCAAVLAGSKIALTQQVGASGQIVSAPPYLVIPYEEDWSYLKDPAERSDWLDRIKYVPIGSSERGYTSIGGEFRGVYERVLNDNWSQTPYGLNSFGLQRYLLHADAHFTPRLRVYLELESGIEQGRLGGPRPIDEKKLDFLNAFVDLRATESHDSPTLRVGKQELQFGSGRVVSVREGPNVRQGFFGFRIDQPLRSWHLTGFAVRPAVDNIGFFNDEPLSNTGFWGVVADRHWRHFYQYRFESYYFGLDRKSATFNKGTAHEVRQTFGGEIVLDPPKDTGDRVALPHFDLEAIYQGGSFGSNSVRAWGLSSETGISFPRVPLTPRLGLRADESSGDNSRNRSLGTYNPLFPIGNYFGVLSDTGPGPVNFRDLHPKLILQASPRVVVTPDWVIWWRQSLTDGVYSVPGGLIVPAGINKARFVGHRPGVETRWQVDRHVYLQGDYGVFFAGPFLREAGKGRNLNYLSFWMGYKF